MDHLPLDGILVLDFQCKWARSKERAYKKKYRLTLFMVPRVLFQPIFTPIIKFNYHGGDGTFGSQYVLDWPKISSES